MRTNQITHTNALLSINSTILSTLRYPAPALSLTKKEWQSITAPLYKTGLPAAGFCNKLPKAIRHGTTPDLGLNIPCLFLTQGILKIMKYMTFITSNTILGQMLRLCEETTKLELGLPGNLYTTPYTHSHFIVTPSWIKHLWHFTSTYHIHLQDHSPKFPTSTNTDTFIMEIFFASNLHKRELIALNKCRKFLKVLTIGDIITGDGTQIIKSIKYGQPSSTATSTMQWPNQSDPGPKAWSIWRKNIKNLLEQDNKLLPSLRPTTWIENKHRRINWFYHRGLDRLFRLTNDNKWLYYAKTIHRGRRGRMPTYYLRGTFNSLPFQATPATTIHI